MTFTITIVLHHSIATASVAVTGATVAWALGSWLQVRLSRTWHARDVIRLGLALLLGRRLLVSCEPKVGPRGRGA